MTRAIIKPDPVSGIDHDELYFQLDCGDRYMECLLQFDKSTREWVLLSNDSEVARF